MQAAKHAARPAQFDQPTKNSRAMIAKIQIGKKQIAVDEDDYRFQIREASGQESLAKCTEKQLARILDWLKSKGFKSVPKKGAATHPMANKARALWISLYHLGAVRNSSEKALEAFAKRQLQCDRLVWARQSDAFKLIEALKAMADRHGWPQSNKRTGKPVSPVTLQSSLCEAIAAKLKAINALPADWSLNTALILLGEMPTAKGYERLATALGETLRFHSYGEGEAA